MTRDEMIEALEKATGPDRQIDAMIWWYADRRNAEITYWSGATGKPRPLPNGMPTSGLGFLAMKGRAPRYTASIDAALTLVPEGYFWSLHFGYGRQCWATVTGPAKDGKVLPESIMHESGSVATPVIALVIAAARAQPSATEGE